MIPSTLAPEKDEAAVCSLLLVRREQAWRLVGGSLLTVPTAIALQSWPRWHAFQPSLRGAPDPPAFDLGPQFVAEPFAGVRIVRARLQAAEWQAATDALLEGSVKLPQVRAHAQVTRWSPTVLITSDAAGDPAKVIAAVRRPVTGVVATIEPGSVPFAEAFWQLASPPHLPRGPELGSLFKHRYLTQWSRSLVGISWHPGFPPPFAFVVGRPRLNIWIADAVIDFERAELHVALGWNEQVIDPLGCALSLRVEQDGLLQFERYLKLSDIPSSGDVAEALRRQWNERLLEIHLPRGARRTAWGLQLYGPDGTLLDERPPVMRVESVGLTMSVAGSSHSTINVVSGDRKPPPTQVETDLAVSATTSLATRAREAAAARRFSTTGELDRYLRWRFSCRAGELLILDPHVSSADEAARVVAFLIGLARPVRALAGAVSSVLQQAVAPYPDIVVRQLPRGRRTLHDRIWIVGETGLLLGGSPSTFLPNPNGNPGRATTATELPHGDTLLWRSRFAEWWPSQ